MSALETFYSANRISLNATGPEVEQMALEIARGQQSTMTLKTFTEWVRDRTRIES